MHYRLQRVCLSQSLMMTNSVSTYICQESETNQRSYDKLLKQCSVCIAVYSVLKQNIYSLRYVRTSHIQIGNRIGVHSSAVKMPGAPHRTKPPTPPLSDPQDRVCTTTLMLIKFDGNRRASESLYILRSMGTISCRNRQLQVLGSVILLYVQMFTGVNVKTRQVGSKTSVRFLVYSGFWSTGRNFSRRAGVCLPKIVRFKTDSG